MGRLSSLGMDAARSRNSALQTVWGLLSSGFLPLLTTMKWWFLLIRQGSGRGRDSAGSLAHTSTSWDYSFGLTVNPVVCEFVCFGQIITSCFLEDTASFPREGSRSYQAARMCGVNKTKRSEPLPPGRRVGGWGGPWEPWCCNFPHLSGFKGISRAGLRSPWPPHRVFRS